MTEPGTRRPVLRAVDALHEDQRALVESLRQGFDQREDIVIWVHKAVARTLGKVPTGWCAQLVADPYRMNRLLNGLEPSAREERLDSIERRLLADQDLLAACREGGRVLYKQAEEHDVDAEVEGKTLPAPSAEEYLAMRPGLQDLVGRQRSLLERVLGRESEYPRGLQSRADVAEWARDLQRATNATPHGLDEASLWNPSATSALTRSPDSPSLHRELGPYLEAMAAAVAEETMAAGEVSSVEKSPHGAMQV